MNQKIYNEIIRNQDRLIYFSINKFLEKLDKDLTIEESYDNLYEIIREIDTEEILNKFSTENLLLIFSKLFIDDKNKQKIEDILMDRFNKGENIFYSPNVEIGDMIGGIQYSWDLAFANFSENNQKMIIDAVNNKFENLKLQDEELYKIADKLDSYLNISNFLSSYDKGLFSDKSIDLTKKIIKRDANIFRAMNFNMLEDEFLNINYEAFIHIIRYPNLCKKLLIIKNNNPELLKEFISEINSIQDTEHISTIYEEIDRIIDSFSKNGYLLDKKSNKDVIELSLKKFELCNEFFKDTTSETIEEFLDKKFSDTIEKEKKIGEKYSSITKESLINEKLEIIFNKYFSISLEDAKRNLKEYGEDILSIEENLDSKDKNTFNQIRKILDITSIEELNTLYETNSITTSAKEMITMESNYREAYALTYIKKFEDTRNKISDNIKNGNVTYVEFENKKIPQIKINGLFNILIHSSDTGFKGNKELKNNNFKETWIDVKDTSQHLVSTTNVNESFMGVAPIGPNGVYYGFVPNNPQNINLMGNEDINSNVRKSNYSAGKSKYISADKMPYYSRRIYSEFAIEKAIPDYIIIFDDMNDKNLQNSYKAATEFEIPIIYMDKREIVKQQKQNIEQLITKFKTTRSLEDLELIIKTYETNKAGWLLNRENENDDTLTESIKNYDLMKDFDDMSKEIRIVLQEFKQNASYDELVGLKSIIEGEESLYKAQNKNEANFTKVKMSNFLKITLDEILELVNNKHITLDEIYNEENRITNIEKGNINNQNNIYEI